ncbi:MAG: S-adenosylmethionine:tRNA ribosyltransferase-isomerase [Bacteroidia bacterium]
MDYTKISDFNYYLPEDKIAYYPLQNRDHSKLLVYKNNKITDDYFYNLANHIDENYLLVFNDTKVIHARLLFTKQTGSHIEILCIEPFEPNEQNLALNQIHQCKWLCMIGNNKKWKNGELIMELMVQNKKIKLIAERFEKIGSSFVINFTWNEPLTFAEILHEAGKLPLPPYLNRDAEDLDEYRYQTVYAQNNGSVAAPTAGLHFTENVFYKLKHKGINYNFVTLHVGAGTFLPVKTEFIANHQMHEERIYVGRDLIENLLNDKKIIAVGTTSLRTLESLYWFGLKLYNNITEWKNITELQVEQWAPLKYKDFETENLSINECFKTILSWMDEQSLKTITGSTQLIITPKYKIKVADALITNFHQPESTLLLLVSAFTNNNWRDIYDHALQNNYRFLSYGDSSILFRC